MEGTPRPCQEGGCLQVVKDWGKGGGFTKPLSRSGPAPFVKGCGVKPLSRRGRALCREELGWSNPCQEDVPAKNPGLGRFFSTTLWEVPEGPAGMACASRPALPRLPRTRSLLLVKLTPLRASRWRLSVPQRRL